MKTIFILSAFLCSGITFGQTNDIKEKNLFKIYQSNYEGTQLTEKEVIKTAKCIKEKRNLNYNEMIYFSDTPKQFVFIPEDKELEQSTQRMEWKNDFYECYYKEFPKSNKEPF